VRATVRRLLAETAGAETIEYALAVGLVALAAVASIAAVGPQLNSWWGTFTPIIQSIPGS
jgi:Flp pilus assembly pilin Flp